MIKVPKNPAKYLGAVDPMDMKALLDYANFHLHPPENVTKAPGPSVPLSLKVTLVENDGANVQLEISDLHSGRKLEGVHSCSLDFKSDELPRLKLELYGDKVQVETLAF